MSVVQPTRRPFRSLDLLNSIICTFASSFWSFSAVVSSIPGLLHVLLICDLTASYLSSSQICNIVQPSSLSPSSAHLPLLLNIRTACCPLTSSQRCTCPLCGDCIALPHADGELLDGSFHEVLIAHFVRLYSADAVDDQCAKGDVWSLKALICLS
jgi:hypothetical protein